MYTLLIIFFLVAIIISFLCSLWEATLLSITPSYAQARQKEGCRIGVLLQDFKQDIDRPLAAILTLNTIAHTVGAIGVGNQASKIWMDANPLITGLAIPVVMTLAILVLSELIPKTIGANYWKELTPFTVKSLALIIFAMYPLVWFSQFVTRAFKKDKSKSVLSRSDFLAMTELGAQEGLFEKMESDVITNLLRFNTVQAKDIMTPQTVVFTAAESDTIATFFEANKDLQFSRIPLTSGESQDHVTGYILKAELLARLVEEDGKTLLKQLRRDISVIEENFPIPRLFSRFLEQREHIAVVVDEFGGMSGIVTMEDVIETLLGTEIVDELDHTEDMQLLARKNWEIRAKSMGIIKDPVDTEPDQAKSGDCS